MPPANQYRRNALLALRAVADAVVLELGIGIATGEIHLPGCVPSRIYDTELELESNSDMRLDVVTNDVRVEMYDRWLRQYDCTVDIVLRKRIDQYDIQGIDWLNDVAGEVLDFLVPSDYHSYEVSGRPLSRLPEASFLSMSVEAPYVPNHLRTLSQFSCILSFTYRIYG